MEDRVLGFPPFALKEKCLLTNEDDGTWSHCAYLKSALATTAMQNSTATTAHVL